MVRREYRLIIFISFMLMALIGAGFFAHKYIANEFAPLLNIVARTPGTLVWGGKEEYYLIRVNGTGRKCATFELADVESYRVDEKDSDYSEILIDSNTGERLNTASSMYEIAYSIIELVNSQSKITNPNIGAIYILGDRYFFDVFDENGYFLSSYSDVIFEYVFEEKRIVEIARFNSRTIAHIQLHEEN